MRDLAEDGQTSAWLRRVPFRTFGDGGTFIRRRTLDECCRNVAIIIFRTGALAGPAGIAWIFWLREPYKGALGTLDQRALFRPLAASAIIVRRPREAAAIIRGHRVPRMHHRWVPSRAMNGCDPAVTGQRLYG